MRIPSLSKKSLKYKQFSHLFTGSPPAWTSFSLPPHPTERDCCSDCKFRFAACPPIRTNPHCPASPAGLASAWRRPRPRRCRAHPDALVIGSDQVASLEGSIMGKPGSHEAAAHNCRASSGQEVRFYTGVALVCAAPAGLVPRGTFQRALSPLELITQMKTTCVASNPTIAPAVSSARAWVLPCSPPCRATTPPAWRDCP